MTQNDVYAHLMIQTREKLRAVFPHIAASELDAAYERLRRYIRIVADMADKTAHGESERLTESNSDPKVDPGTVDPNTFSSTIG